MVALSGGVDSMCLTYLLSQYKSLFHPSLAIHAVTIDHGYRPGSEEEAAKVGRLVAKWGVDHLICRLHYDKNVEDISNFEEVARYMRYKTFQQKSQALDIDALLVGHTLDDKLETYLQRLQMNSTIFGLDGLKDKSQFPLPPTSPLHHLNVYRPLLPFEKFQLQETCREGGVEWFEDHTNMDRWLTKRNMFRYLLNHYIPGHVHSRPKLAVISKSALLQTTKLIDSVLNQLHEKVLALDNYVTNYGGFEFLEDRALIKFSVPIDFWSNVHSLVASRWLYNLIYSISSAQHFHWSYAKIERAMIPRLNKFIVEELDKTSMTYLNVLFTIEKRNGTLNFAISKQPPIRDTIPDLCHSLVATTTFSPWILYDKTWWMRIRDTQGTKVRIHPYTLKMRKSLQKAFPNLRNLPQGNATVPVITNELCGDILALPTFGLVRENLEVECILKK
ncbi:CIC11C00000000301 [Sungouiella intermedia]|uniref:tRNA(Ile)-lysidine synthetase n=1 Tax=Sungouiella intermedia TaxID=45354 RepID=A0A1L0DKT5_9ASCO|nr:CIC11C00000000301 [[Candida] intermedia]